MLKEYLMFCELSVGFRVEINHTAPGLSFCANLSPNTFAARKQTDLHNQACPGLLCVRPRLCVAQCGNAALQSQQAGCLLEWRARTSWHSRRSIWQSKRWTPLAACCAASHALYIEFALTFSVHTRWGENGQISKNLCVTIRICPLSRHCSSLVCVQCRVLLFRWRARLLQLWVWRADLKLLSQTQRGDSLSLSLALFLPLCVSPSVSLCALSCVLLGRNSNVWVAHFKLTGRAESGTKRAADRDSLFGFVAYLILNRW